MAVKAAAPGSFGIPTQPGALISVTAGAAGTYGTYTQMLAATAAPIFLTQVSIRAAAAETYAALKIGTGPATETDVGEVLFNGWAGTPFAPYNVPILPWIPVATATRIAIKIADNTGADAFTVGLIAINQANVVDAGLLEAVNISQVGGLPPIADAGTAQAGAAGTITLRAGAPAVSLVGWIVLIESGPGAGQWRYITAYNTGTKVATVATWVTQPTSASTYVVFGF